MAIYTVHQPLLRKRETAPDPERFVFVRDGFYFWALVLGPVWMLWRRLWLVLFLYIATMAIVETGLWYLRAGTFAQATVGLLLALLVGIEAGSLWRWTLARRGLKNIGVVVGDDLESAERRFFAAWTAEDGGKAVIRETIPPPAPPPMRMPQGQSSDVIGLFPEPGANR